MKQELIAQPEHVGQRLDVFVTAVALDVSRGAVQKSIKDGEITLNGRLAKPHTALREGDVVAISSLEPTPSHAVEPTAQDIKLRIVFEDQDLLVVNKPSGMLVHPTVRSERDTLAAAALAHAPEVSGVGDGPERPGIMQRLDKEASGLMVIAKNQKAYDHLKQQFMEHSVEKRYVILVHGRPPQDEGTINLAIGRSLSERRMAARSQPLEGDRPAITHYRVMRHLRSATLIEARTETGRTHQIRAHFRALGCPVAGDKLYGHKLDRLHIGRLFLHAETLGFTHPTTGERLEFHAPITIELERAIETLSLATDPA
ncbi:MAG: RluA family pseudouridine synthase [Patescibacteria group bacterium]